MRAIGTKRKKRKKRETPATRAITRWPLWGERRALGEHLKEKEGADKKDAPGGNKQKIDTLSARSGTTHKRRVKIVKALE